jgi:hypothetical protein
MTPLPIFRISFNNATLLTVIYFFTATAIEGARRLFGWGWTERVSEHLERFPAGVLQTLGVLLPLRSAFIDERLSLLSVRLIFGLTTVAVFFLTAALVGTAMWALTKLGSGSDSSKPAGP